MFKTLKRLLIGQSIETKALKNEKFSVFWGLPILSSDAISSVAYAGEEILYVLIPTMGMLSYKYMLIASLCIIGLLSLLIFGYRQTIDNYPNGGGSYIVSRENLGVIPSLVAAAALSIGYILTVAVSVSAGTAAITSTFPEALNYKVPISVVLILLLAIGNLRGMRESARIFGTPTYIFIGVIVSMIIIGVVKVKVFGYIPHTNYTIPNAVHDITLALFLRAFAAGCTALTGVEAISDGIPNFQAPAQKNAKKVLTRLAIVMLVVFGGMAYLSTMYHAVPNPNMTVSAQIAEQVFDGNMHFMFYVMQGLTAIILILAANTAFADFPLLISFISADGFAPRQYTMRGDRLSYSNGIITLALLASLLVIGFNGNTHTLLPLYAIGVFMSFTLSQFGMFTKWIKERNSGWKHKAVINGIGSIVTFGTTLIVGATKFMDGAWAVCIIIPIVVVAMLKVKKHYNNVASELKITKEEIQAEMAKVHAKTAYTIVLIGGINKSSIKALAYARRKVADKSKLIAFHVCLDEEEGDKIKQKWEDYELQTQLVVKYAPYRDIKQPLLDYIQSVEHESKPGDIITIVMPQFVVRQEWENIFHNQTTHFIRRELLKHRNLAIDLVPFVLSK